MINWPELEELIDAKRQETVVTREDRMLLELSEDEAELESRTLRRRLADAFVFLGNKIDPEAVSSAKAD